MPGGVWAKREEESASVSTSWPKKERTGPTLKEEALDNHSTVSRVPAQKYSPGKEERGKKRKEKEKENRVGENAFPICFPFSEQNRGKKRLGERKALVLWFIYV